MHGAYFFDTCKHGAYFFSVRNNTKCVFIPVFHTLLTHDYLCSQEFPWIPKPVEELNGYTAPMINEQPALIWLTGWGCNIMHIANS